MTKRNCTAVLNVHHGREKLCGRLDACTQVTVKRLGKPNIERWVCKRCRKRMGLPKRDVVIEGG